MVLLLLGFCAYRVRVRKVLNYVKTKTKTKKVYELSYSVGDSCCFSNPSTVFVWYEVAQLSAMQNTICQMSYMYVHKNPKYNTDFHSRMATAVRYTITRLLLSLVNFKWVAGLLYQRKDVLIFSSQAMCSLLVSGCWAISILNGVPS